MGSSLDLTLLLSERPKLYGVLAVLSAKGLKRGLAFSELTISGKANEKKNNKKNRKQQRMCETLRAELKLSFKFSTLDLTIVGAHYDVPNDSQQVICACQY